MNDAMKTAMALYLRSGPARDGWQYVPAWVALGLEAQDRHAEAAQWKALKELLDANS